MEKRVVFRSAWLPYVLLAPQIAVTIVFFFWPAAQAAWFSFQLQDAFGLRTEFVGLQNFEALFADPHYLASFRTTAVFSALVAFSGIAISLLFATMADRVLRGALAYKTLLIWPYAVAPAVAGVLWAFMFAPSIGIVTYVLKRAGIDWNWIIQGDQAMPFTEGTLCTKVAYYLERTYAPDRLQYPMRRVGRKGQGQFKRIAWDEALDEIAARLKALAAENPEAMLPCSYAGTMGMVQYMSMDRRFFYKLGASLLERTLCSSAGKYGLKATLGGSVGMDPL